jgi:uncharacterized protein (TIGR02145 family)
MAKRFYIEQFSAAESNARYVVEIHDPQHQQLAVKYALLYNWYAATDARLIAADGWEVPETIDYETLAQYSGAVVEPYGFGGNRIVTPNTIGIKFKEIGTTYWDSPNTGATNELNFNARGGGQRNYSTSLFSTFKNNLTLWTRDDAFTYSYRVFGLVLTYSSQQLSQWTFAGIDRRASGMNLRLIKTTTTLSNGQTGTYTGNDGKVYRTICIGTQEWLADNLCETKYRNGDDIPEVTDNTEWAALTTGALCAYDNDWDNAFEIVDGDATLLDGSFTLRYDEGKVSDILFPLLPSVAEITVNVTEADTLFEDFVEELPTRSEEDLVVKIFREDVQIWMGQIPTDLIDYPDQYYTYQVNISAVCGLSRLKNIKYDDAGTPFEGRNTILGHFLNCLAKLNYPSALNTLPILKVIGFQWEEDNMLLSANSHLENIDLAYDCFQQYDDFGVIDSQNCYEVLEYLCRKFHFRLYMSGNVFGLQQLNEGNNADAYTYAYNGTLLDTEILDVTRSFDLQRTDGNYSNYPPVREISLLYNYKQGINRGNLLPAAYVLGTTESLGTITGGGGEVLRISIAGSMRVIIETAEAWFIRYKLTVQVGTKYLGGTQSTMLSPVAPYWSDTADFFTVDFGPYISVQTQPLSIEILTPAIDPGGVGTFKFELVDTYENITTPVVLDPGTYIATFNSVLCNVVFENDEGSNGKIKFTAINTTDGTTPISSNVTESLPDTIIGDGPRIYSSGRLRVHHGSDVWSNSDAWAAYNGGTAMNINKLRLQETLCIKKSVIKSFDFTLLEYASMYEYLIFKTDYKLFVLGYELDPEFDSVNLQTVFLDFDRTNILINTEQDAPDSNGGSSGGGGGTSSSHLRLHDVLSTLDHAPAVGSDKGKALGNNVTTGAIEWFDKLWKKVGTVLSPATDGDKIEVVVSGSNAAITGSSPDSRAVQGVSTNSSGIYGQSTYSIAGYFSSVNSRAFDGYINPSSNNTLVTCMQLQRNTSETAAIGIGVSMTYAVETDNGTVEQSGESGIILTNVTLATITSDFIIKLKNAGAALAEVMRLTGAGVLNVKTGFSVDGTAAVADGTYTVGIGTTTNGTITVKGGIITAITEAT